MTGLRLLLALVVAFAASLLTASAQVGVQISMPRNSYVAGEDVQLTITISNYAGRDLQFRGDTRQNWIDFNVMNGQQQPLSPIAQAAFGTMSIPAGQSKSRTVSLAAMYGLQNMGNFSVYAMVRLPGQASEGTLSNRLNFNVYTPKPYWTQRIGTPDGRQREFRVMNYSSGDKTMLYSQVVDPRTNAIVNTQSLGEALMLRKPTIAVDNKQVMHVLYQITPSIWGHVKIGADGRFLGRDLQQSAGGDPQLVTLGTGAVQMDGGIPYDPKAEAEAKSKVRKATDRPSMTFR